MKIEIEIDISPQELREFMGFPDVREFQTELMSRLRAQVEAGMDGADPLSVLTRMAPAGMPFSFQGWEALQKAFWSGMLNTGQRTRSEDED